jgi:hypothetical protein
MDNLAPSVQNRAVLVNVAVKVPATTPIDAHARPDRRKNHLASL